MGRIYGRTTGWAYIAQFNKIIRVKVIPGALIRNGVKYIHVKPYGQVSDSEYFEIEPRYTATTKEKALEKLKHLISE